MGIGQKLKAIRRARNITQVELARAAGFVQPYISRGENEHFTPSLETLEKWARALGLTVYQLLRDSEEPPESLRLSSQNGNDRVLWGNSGQEAMQLGRLRRALAKMDEAEREVVLSVAGRMASRLRSK
jgi:transcriptional regulator with XRE-family HTH domain